MHERQGWCLGRPNQHGVMEYGSTEVSDLPSRAPTMDKQIHMNYNSLGHVSMRYLADAFAKKARIQYVCPLHTRIAGTVFWRDLEGDLITGLAAVAVVGAC